MSYLQLVEFGPYLKAPIYDDNNFDHLDMSQYDNRFFCLNRSPLGSGIQFF